MDALKGTDPLHQGRSISESYLPAGRQQLGSLQPTPQGLEMSCQLLLSSGRDSCSSPNRRGARGEGRDKGIFD